jgi:hypothetical protein
MVDDLYIEPNRRAQIIVFFEIILAALLFSSLSPIVNYLTPNQNAPLEELEAGAKLLSLLALGANIFGFIISLFWVVYFGSKGYRTLKLGSYPPSGTIVVRRTKILTGRQAIHAGYLSISFAVLMGLFTLLIGYKIWLLTKLWFLTL